MLLDRDTRYGLRLQVDSAVRRNLGLPPQRVNPRRKPGNFQKRWSNEEIREKIRAVANALGKTKITQSEYARFIQQYDGTLFPSHVTVRRCKDEFAQS